jgi:hypothetical protein
MYPESFNGPQAWTEQTFTDPAAWVLPCGDEIKRGLLSAVAATKRKEGFPIPPFALVAAEIKHRLLHGCGFAIFRGLPTDDYSEDDLRLIYEGLGSHLGAILPQNLRGEKLYSVRDEGVRMEADYGQTGARFSKTNSAFDFHTDSPSRVAGHTPDFIGLLALRTAKTGGESAFVSGYTIHNILRAERPDILRRLYQPFWVDRRAELPPGEDPVLPVSVFSFREKLTVRYLRYYITKGQEFKQEPLSEGDLEALDFFESVTRRPGIAVSVPAECGDLQFVSNTFLLHSRTSFVDHPEPERKRHYIRLWLADRGA